MLRISFLGRQCQCPQKEGPTRNRKQGGTSHQKQKTGWDIPPETENSEMKGSICRSVGGIQWTVKQSGLRASMQQSYRLLMPGRRAEQDKTQESNMAGYAYHIGTKIVLGQGIQDHQQWTKTVQKQLQKHNFLFGLVPGVLPAKWAGGTSHQIFRACLRWGDIPPKNTVGCPPTILGQRWDIPPRVVHPAKWTPPRASYSLPKDKPQGGQVGVA